MPLDREAAKKAVKTISDALGVSLVEAAQGIVDIVNENMFGALRLVSVEQGYDPRDFALVAFGGAGPLHANALGILLGCWPVIIPPSPGVLCAYGDATTKERNEASRTFIRPFSGTTLAEVSGMLGELKSIAAATLDAEGVPRADQTVSYQVDVRYHGQGLELPIVVDIDSFKKGGLDHLAGLFDETHKRLFTFGLEAEKEIVNLRAIVQGKPPRVETGEIAKGDADPSVAKVSDTTLWVRKQETKAPVYARAKLRAGNMIAGPAIVTEMDFDHADPPRPCRRGSCLRQHPRFVPSHADRKGTSCKKPASSRPIRRRSSRSRSIRSRSIFSKVRCATRAMKWTPCCSALRCRPEFASNMTSFR